MAGVQDTDVTVPPENETSPSRISLAATSGAATLSAMGGLAGAALYDDPILDWLWLTWGVLGLLAGVLTLHSALKRHKYISSLLALGLKAQTSDDLLQVDGIIRELLTIGATHEVELLTSRLQLSSARR
jgi:hypothetical protein